MSSNRRSAFGVVVLAAVVLSGCGDRGGRAQEAAPQGGGSVAAPAVVTSAAVADRKVVYTADLVVRVSSVGKASVAAIEETKRVGGYLFSQDADEEANTTELTLKVPSDRLEPFLESIAGLGRVLRRGVKAQDVTAEVVDVDGRLKTAQASAERLRSLLTEAKSAQDVVAVEGELAKRETEIESLQGRLRVLTDQVDLATIDLRLTERNDLRVEDDLPGFVDGVRAGAVTLANVGLGALVAVGFALPFTPLVGLSIWSVRRYRRRHPRPPRTLSPAWIPPPAAPPAEQPPAGDSPPAGPDDPGSPPRRDG